jgi:hypothetical protein
MAPSGEEFFVDINSGGENVAVRVWLKNSFRGKNLCVRVVGENEVLLTKPRYASKREAVDFLEKNKSWIAERLQTAPKRITLRGRLGENPAIYACGAELKVSLMPSRSDSFFVEDTARGEIVFCAKDDCGLSKIFREYAAKKLSESAFGVSLRLGLDVRKISVRGQSGRWGSMSSSGTMSLNWRIIFLRPELQNYILCHEFAHTKFMDHSVSFWIFLNRICPNAKRLDRELAKMGRQIISIE